MTCDDEDPPGETEGWSVTDPGRALNIKGIAGYTWVGLGSPRSRWREKREKIWDVQLLYLRIIPWYSVLCPFEFDQTNPQKNKVAKEFV